jgi:hypothetical protein
LVTGSVSNPTVVILPTVPGAAGQSAAIAAARAAPVKGGTTLVQVRILLRVEGVPQASQLPHSDQGEISPGFMMLAVLVVVTVEVLGAKKNQVVMLCYVRGE